MLRILVPFLALVAAAAACDGERLRPGPPILTLTGPASGTVFPAETLAVAVRATDDHGIDSVTVGYLGEIAVIHGDARTSVEDLVFVRLAGDLLAGAVVTVTGVAVDLGGFETRESLALTVIDPP